MISKLFFLLNKKERKQTFFLVFLIIVSMVFELFGIALLIPTISLLIDNEYINSSEYLNRLSNFLSNYNIDVILFFLIALILIFPALIISL